MKEIIFNKDNLKDEEITEVVKWVKILLINSKNEVLLGYSYNEYQFIGGHVEEGEDLLSAVYREIKEETGIEVEKDDSLEPFAVNYGYYKDWPEINKNRKIEIYYYEVKCDCIFDLSKVEYTEHERKGNFELRYILLENIEKEIQENAATYGDKRGIAKEMIELFKIYKK